MAPSAGSGAKSRPLKGFLATKGARWPLLELVWGHLTSTIDVLGRRALRSAGTNRLVVPPVRLATVGSRAIPIAAAHTWNSLPEHTVSASTLQSFKRHLKTFLLQQSFRLAL